MEKSFAQTFQDILNALEITYYRMAKDTGLSTAQLGKHLVGTKPGHETIATILSTYPQLNAEYLLFGTGEVLKEGNAKQIGIFGDMEFVDVPYLPLKVHASFIASYEETTPIKLEKYPVVKNGISTKNCLLIEVNGNSMKPTVNHGAKILAEKVERGNWGDVSGVLAVLYKDFFVVKRVRENEINSFRRLTLYSDNVNGGTVTIDGSDIREIWKVVKVYEQFIE